MEAFAESPLRDWKLQTTKNHGDWYHTRSTGIESWRPVKSLGSGSFGEVWQEQCTSRPSQSSVRAVKHLQKRQAKFLEMSQRELNALVTFSEAEVGSSRKIDRLATGLITGVAVQALLCPIPWLV